MLLRNHHVEVSSLTNGVDLSGSVVLDVAASLNPLGMLCEGLCVVGPESFGAIFDFPFTICLHGKSPLAQSFTFHQCRSHWLLPGGG